MARSEHGTIFAYEMTRAHQVGGGQEEDLLRREPLHDIPLIEILIGLPSHTSGAWVK